MIIYLLENLNYSSYRNKSYHKSGAAASSSWETETENRVLQPLKIVCTSVNALIRPNFAKFGFAPRTQFLFFIFF